MYGHDLYSYNNCTGTITEGPSSVIYFPGVTPVPIELTCSITGIVAWKVNGSIYLYNGLTNGALPGHNLTGTNLLVDSPVNNTEYVCMSQTAVRAFSSDPAYIFFAGECCKMIEI